MTVNEEKSILRKKIKLVLKEMSDKERFFQSEEVCKKILSSKEYLNADSLFSYMAMNEELNLDTVNENCHDCKEKKLFLPRVVADDGLMFFYEIKKDFAIKEQCIKNKWNIFEPEDKEENKFNLTKLNVKNILILVPGLAFTKDKKRLGRGKGFYDRALAKLKDECLKNKCNLKILAVCFRQQVVEDIPCCENDFTVDEVLFF